MDWHDEQVHGCERKTRYGRDLARKIAAEQRAVGNPLTAYRCPWCTRWHIGHVPTLDRLQAIADAIRARAQDPAA